MVIAETCPRAEAFPVSSAFHAVHTSEHHSNLQHCRCSNAKLLLGVSRIGSLSSACMHVSRDGTTGQSSPRPHVKICWTENPLRGGRREHWGNPVVREMETWQVRARHKKSSYLLGFRALPSSRQQQLPVEVLQKLGVLWGKENVLEKRGLARSTAVSGPFPGRDGFGRASKLKLRQWKQKDAEYVSFACVPCSITLKK